MLTFKMIIVFFGLIGMVTALVLDKMRPGMILFSVTVLFLCFGILTPKEILEGFSNKGMITVALLFLISEGVRQSGALGQLIKKLLPQEKTTVMKAQARMLPVISFVSAFLNNTPVVVIFAPIIKRWAESVCIPATKFLIPISYATILGGMCTLIGTSTNLVVDGMILDAGYKGFGMFELGRVGIFIALAGVVYLLFFSSRLLPEVRKDTVGDEHGEADASSFHRVEAVIGARFPGINKRVGDFNFVRHYGAEVKEIKRSGVSIVDNLSRVKFREGDTLVLWADDSFISTWGGKEGLESTGLKVFGGENAPYLWVKAPRGISSWKFFEQMLYEANVVGTPGVGFGPSGESYIRLTAFGERADCEKAMKRIRRWIL